MVDGRFGCNTQHFDQVGTPSPDVSTPSSSTIVQAIRLLYGQTLAKELLNVTTSSSGKGSAKPDNAMDTSDDDEDGDSE